MYPRPHWSILNESIPMFVIGKNRDGFWIASDSEGHCRGEFYDRAAAVNFARQESAPGGCALMFVDEPVESDSGVATSSEGQRRPQAGKETLMTLMHLAGTALIKTGKFLRQAFEAIAEAREQKAIIETQLYRGRYKHSSKFDDDLPIVHR